MKHGSVTHSDIIEVRPTYLKRDERWFYCVALDVLFDFLRLIVSHRFTCETDRRWPVVGRQQGRAGATR